MQGRDEQRYRVKPVSLIVPHIIEYRIRRIESRLARDPLVYYATDLVKCSKKREFEITHPKLLFTRALSGRTFIGEMVHKGLESLLKEIFGDDIVIELNGDGNLDKSREIVINNVRYVIKGRIDAIINGDTGVEIKTTTTHGQLPYPHHVEQAMIYNWLYGLRRTIILYITPDGLYEYEVTQRFTDDDIIMMIREPRSPRWSWECQHCEFKSICPIPKHKTKPEP